MSFSHQYPSCAWGVTITRNANLEFLLIRNYGMTKGLKEESLSEQFLKPREFSSKNFFKTDQYLGIPIIFLKNEF